MKKKYQNKEALYERMRELANPQAKINENKSRSLGTLIDYKRGADNVAYGIVKENHQYFIKKSNKQQDPLVEDFAYIGGLENVHEYRYQKLSEADKNRNMLLLTINEALGGKDNLLEENNSENTTEKNILSESKEDKKEEKKEEESEDKKEGKEEIEEGKKEDVDKDGDIDSDDYLAKKDAAIKKAEKEEDKEKVDEGTEEELEQAAAKLDAAEEKAEEIPAEPAAPELDVDNIEVPPAEGGEEIEASTEELPPAEDGEGEVAPALGGDADEENNREIEKTIGKVTNKIRKTDMTPMQVKSYINSFISAFDDKLPELEIEERKEMANRILKVVPDSEEELEKVDVETEMEEARVCNECGFAKYAESRGYGPDSLMECSIDEVANLMNGYAMECEGNIPEEDLATMAILSNSEIAESLVNEYGQTELAENMQPFTTQINEVEDTDKKSKVDGMFWWKYEPQKDGKKKDKLTTEGMNGNEPTNVETQPDVIKEDDEIEIENNDEEENTEIDLTPGFDTMGAGVAKPDGAGTTSVDVNVDAENKTVNISMSESEQKLRKYIRARLEEKAGTKKPLLNEDKKSAKIKKLDKMIDEQYQIFETIIKENGDLNEIFGLSKKEKFRELDMNDEAAVNDLFNKVFRDILHSMGAIRNKAKNTPINVKYEILKQYFEQDGGTLRLSPDGNIQYAPQLVKDKATMNPMAGGGTQGKTAYGGV